MTTTPTVSVSAVPMDKWSNPTPAPNTYMGSVNINSGASTNPSGGNSGNSSSSNSNPIIASSSQSSSADNKTMVDAQKMNVDNTDLTNNHNNTIALLQSQMDALETRRQNEIASINSAFDAKSNQLSQTQKSESGTYTATLARMGGYLGNTASATSAMVNLNNTHQAQISDLESRRQAAVQAANSAIDDKSFELARMKIQEAKDYTAAIQKSKQDFFNNNKKVIEDQQQSQKDSAIAKLYSDGTTDVASIITSLKGLGIYATADDINKTITSLVPPAISDLVKNLDKYGAPGDIKLKVLNSKNASEAYANAGVWANLGGEGKPGAYNFYVASQKAAGKPYVDYMTFDNQDQILKNQQNQTAGYTGGSAYTTPGASGEYGAYQFTPDTWKNYAGEILNDPNAPMTPANQDAVAVGMISKWVADGKTPEQIAIKWNHGDFTYKGSGTGVNDKGVKYDIPGYVAKFKDNLSKLGGGKDPATIAKAIKLTETGGGPGDVAVERAVNVISGSNKFTKDQKNSFISSMNNATNVGDAFSIIKNQAKDVMSGTTQTKVENYQNANTAMDKLSADLKDFYANGGDTNIFAGTYEQAAAKLGTVDNPALRSLAAQIESSLQIYRNAVSGTAYSVQEGNAIASIFPGIDKTQGLNDAILKARKDVFNTQIDGYYRDVLGSSYDELKKTAEVSGKTTADVLNEQHDKQLSTLHSYYADPQKKAEIDSKIQKMEATIGRKITSDEFLQAYPSYGN